MLVNVELVLASAKVVSSSEQRKNTMILRIFHKNIVKIDRAVNME